MRSSLYCSRFKRLRSRRGAALIVTLSFVVLLSVLVIAFLARSLNQRRVEAAGAGAQQAELLVRDGVRIVLDDLGKEIEAGSGDYALNQFYLPSSAAAMVPARALMPAVMAAAPTSAGSPFFRLVKQSGAGRFYPAAAPYVATPAPAFIMSGGASSAAAALNGRAISLSRWNAPRLLGGDGFTDPAEAPGWIYIDHDSGLSSATTAEKALTGRIAFNVYDVSGQLDLNVVGAPGSLLGEGMVGLPGGVEPRWLGNGTVINELLEWRDRSTMSNAIGYLDYQRLTGPQQGFRGAPSGDRRFLTRRDLIAALDQYFNGLSDMLPHVGHFSLAVDSPGMRGAAATAASNPQPVGVRHPAASTITTYRLNGQALSYSVRSGDPLLTYRFSLDRLQWLTHQGPVHTDYEPAILACFGLRWNTTDRRWEYIGSDGATVVQDRILTLGEVASAGREPNFFELLKAGMIEGSLGGVATAATLNPDQNAIDQVRDRQVMQIGANIIDSSDADNFPTRLAFSISGTVHTLSGVEDLPYLWGGFVVGFTAYGANIGSSTTRYPRHRFDLVMTPHLFNPHGANSGSAASGPTQLRVRMEGELRRIQLRAALAAGGGNVYYNGNATVNLATKTPVSFPITAASYRAMPGIPLDSGTVNPARYSSQLPHFVGNGMGFVLQSAIHSPAIEVDGQSTTPANIWLEGVNMILEYQDGAQWVAYDRLTGAEGLSGAIQKEASATFNLMNVGSRVVETSGGGYLSSFDNDSLTRSYLPKPDPRTTRYSLSWSPSANYGGGTNGPADQMPAATVTFANAPPFASWSTAQLLTLPQGGLSASASPGQAADPDGVVRPADGYRGAAANPLQATAAATARPIILQRPYRSVGELGYVFRDVPWKTLDLSSERSGDSALLELFCVGESVREDAAGAPAQSPLIAGKVNLNAASGEVLAAVLGNGLLAEGDFASRLASTDAALAAEALVDASAVPRLLSLAGLPEWLAPGNAVLSVEHRTTKRGVEQISRSLSSVGQVRTWNLMIDMIAQSGKFPPSKIGEDLNGFAVDGESRFWIFVAIDRLTGEVLEVRFETPYE